MARTLVGLLSKRGGAEAGDPNHPALSKANPNVTYNPFPPQSSYLPESRSSSDFPATTGVEYMSYRAKMIAILGSISGLLSILLVGWTVFRCCQRKRKAMARKRESSFGSRRLFPPLSRAAGWRDLPPHRDGHYPDDDHSVDGPSGAAPHQPIYGNEVFEMSKDFNRSNYDLPFSSAKQQEYEDENDGDMTSSPSASSHTSSNPKS
ncbi:hypothetical protein VP01_1857g4 [Puccinia sorghi]|uniref:Uncharacterized protein n=1 Tax=Puccinia sorghi TaxID=27349 RepID=A0A0L6VDG5_9BASI|nr:hypothetical protein VP01_1857g4 [Puccinia sorghi]